VNGTESDRPVPAVHPESGTPPGASFGTSAQHAAAEAILGHRFARPALLSEALTHRSATAPRSGRGRKGAGSNERLEFIGDRVLGLVIAEWLIERFPQEQEGELGRRFGHLVSRPVLAEIAQRLRLDAALAIGAGEARAGVGQLANTLADAMEAAIGALFLDAGLDVPRRFVREAWAQAMDIQVRPPKDPKTSLQEWLMARGLPLPDYVETERTGPSHAPVFSVAVSGAGATGEGRGSSKREAERLAALDLLGRLK
jgi:ribonuclease-3